MSYDSLLRIPCDLLVRSFSDVAEDEHGTPVPETSVISTTCFLSRQRRTETGVPETESETFSLYLRSDAPVDGWDGVEVGGQVYELIGPPEPVFRGLTGLVHHIEATIRVSNPERTFSVDDLSLEPTAPEEVLV